VVQEMTRALREAWGNPSSVHAEGAAARSVVERARARVASLLGVDAGEVIFTGSATEANNTALCGIAPGLERGRHLVTTTVEHPSVEAPAEVLEKAGWRVTRVPVDAEGRVDPQAIAAALTPETALVSTIWANNETGVVLPVDAIAEVVGAHGALHHVDATQAVGKLPVDLRRTPADLLSLSAHKLGGPKGTGCLIVRRGVPFAPLLHGGPQESRRRGGTENVAGIAGLGRACELAEHELPDRMRRDAALRDRLWDGIQEKVPHVRRNGAAEAMLPNTLNVEFERTAGEVLLQALDVEGIAVSAGAACASGSITPSSVLTAMGRSPEQARGSLRLSVGHGIDEAQIDRVLQVLPECVARVRAAEGA
jgi:cysteine desulfurase